MTKSPECVTKKALSFSVGMAFAEVKFLSQRLLLFVKMTTSFFNMEMTGLTTCLICSLSISRSRLESLAKFV